MLLASRPARLVTVIVSCGLLMSACTPGAPVAPTSTALPPPKPTAPAQAAPAPPVSTAPSTAGTPAASGSSAPLIVASLANLSPTLHPYPDSASYTQSWSDAAIL